MHPIDDKPILVINAGSSSVKFELRASQPPFRAEWTGVIEGFERGPLQLSSRPTAGGGSHPTTMTLGGSGLSAAVGGLGRWLVDRVASRSLAAIGHRIVHGGPTYVQPSIVTEGLLDTLRGLRSLDPVHLPMQIRFVEELQRRFPRTVQVACFDTAFHQTLPPVAKLLAIPHRYTQAGLRRFGFHGLAYASLVRQLAEADGQTAAEGRLILAHLGSGASVTAVYRGRSLETTMGLTPASGVMMSTRSGDLDPGVLTHLADRDQLTGRQLAELVYAQSGLLGVSGRSGDMKDLLAHEADDRQAQAAIDLFCYQIKKSIGSLAAVLGGIDTLVFSGGIGAQAPAIRSRITAGLEFLGIVLDPTQNKANAARISAPTGRVVVRVIAADEATMIVQQTAALLRRAPVE